MTTLLKFKSHGSSITNSEYTRLLCAYNWHDLNCGLQSSNVYWQITSKFDTSAVIRLYKFNYRIYVLCAQLFIWLLIFWGYWNCIYDTLTLFNFFKINRFITISWSIWTIRINAYSSLPHFLSFCNVNFTFMHTKYFDLSKLAIVVWTIHVFLVFLNCSF